MPWATTTTQHSVSLARTNAATAVLDSLLMVGYQMIVDYELIVYYEVRVDFHILWEDVSGHAHDHARRALRDPAVHRRSRAVPDGLPPLVEQLCDLGDHRIADMDAAGIDVQVLSLTAPGVEQLDATEAVALAREANDRLADAVRRHPSRFAAFAALPTAAPETAADELERTVREHGFRGAMINGHTRGRYLDDEFFWPILERAEALAGAGLLASHPAAAAGGRGGLHGNLRGRGGVRAGDRSLGLARGHRDPCPAPRPRRRVRSVPESAARHRPYGRDACRSCCRGSNWPSPIR